MKHEVHSTSLDENWKPVYPQDVPIGGLIRNQVSSGYYITLRRVPTTVYSIQFDHAWPGRVLLEKPPWTK